MYDMLDMNSDTITPISNLEKSELVNKFNEIVINGVISKQSYYSLCSALESAKEQD